MLGSLLHFEKKEEPARRRRGSGRSGGRSGARKSGGAGPAAAAQRGAGGAGSAARTLQHDRAEWRGGPTATASSSPALPGAAQLNRTWGGAFRGSAESRSTALSRLLISYGEYESSPFRDRSRSFDAIDARGKTRSLSSSDLNAAVESLAKIRFNGAHKKTNHHPLSHNKQFRRFHRVGSGVRRPRSRSSLHADRGLGPKLTQVFIGERDGLSSIRSSSDINGGSASPGGNIKGSQQGRGGEMPSRNNSARDTRRERQRLASLNAFLQTDTTHNRSSSSTLQISSSLSSSGNTLRGVTQPSSTIHGCFEQWVFIHPERTALICSDGRRLSFLVLNRMANRLARMLLKYGVPDRSAVVAMSSPQPSSSKTRADVCGGVAQQATGLLWLC